MRAPPAFSCAARQVNPRIQVEHTVTEEVTSVDLVQTQMLIAGGASLEQLGLSPQENIKARGVAIQCRVTTEDPEKGFAPDAGTLSVFRNALGAGVRVDGVGYSGMVVTPFYDSLLVKCVPERNGRRHRTREQRGDRLMRGKCGGKSAASSRLRLSCPVPARRVGGEQRPQPRTARARFVSRAS